MSFITLEEANVYALDDQIFLYEVLKFRWANKEIINIKYKHEQKDIPTFEEHVQHITSNKYKKIYKILIKSTSIGMVYIDKNNVNGTFIVPKFLKQALKLHKIEKSEQNKSLSAMIHIELFKRHPEVTLHYATVNPDNKHSLNSLLDNGYEITEVILALQTKDGKVTQGRWKQV